MPIYHHLEKAVLPHMVGHRKGSGMTPMLTCHLPDRENLLPMRHLEVGHSVTTLMPTCRRLGSLLLPRQKRQESSAMTPMLTCLRHASLRRQRHQGTTRTPTCHHLVEAAKRGTTRMLTYRLPVRERPPMMNWMKMARKR